MWFESIPLIPIEASDNAFYLNTLMEMAAHTDVPPRQLDKLCSELLMKSRMYEYQLMNDVKKRLTSEVLEKKNWIEQVNVIQACFNLLLVSHKNDVAKALIFFSHIFEELNDRISFFYRIINEQILGSTAQIPVMYVTEHHQAVEYVYRTQGEKLGTVLSFDSHPDLNKIHTGLNLYNHLKNRKTVNFDSVESLYRLLNFDCGAVIVPMLAPYKSNSGVIWVFPDWLGENHFSVTTHLGEHSGLITIKSQDDKLAMLFDRVPIKKEDKPVHFSATTVLKLIEHSRTISERYILNIDLDYFASYGEQQTSPFGDDQISDLRTEIDFKRAQKDEIYKVKKKEELTQEIAQIQSRIDAVVRSVDVLKRRGKTPALIIICDSTRVDFSSVPSGWGYGTRPLSMEFTPKYLTFWIKQSLLHGLKRVLAQVCWPPVQVCGTKQKQGL